MRKTLLNAVIATATGDPDFAADRRASRTYQATVTGTGAVSATVIIEGSNEDQTSSQSYVTLATITLSGTTTATDGFVSLAQWAYVRARLTAISGTGAAVTATMGC